MAAPGGGAGGPFDDLLPFFQACRVRPAAFDGFGLGMRCEQPVGRGEELLSVPLERCWTAAAARAAPELASLGEELLDAVSDESAIALHMLVVRSQGAAAGDACRRGHVAILEGAEYETLLDWGPEDLAMLEGSKWAMVAPRQLQDMREEFAELEELLGEFFTAHGITWEGFFWAHRLLISRSVSFFMEDGSTLVVLGPGQDMFNHSVDVPVGTEDVCLTTAPSGERLLTIRAFRDFAAGEQAFYSYSGASNGRLLMMAGFVVPENPFNAVELCFELPAGEASRPLFRSLAEGLDAGVRTPGAVAAETKSEFLDDGEEGVALHARLTGEGLGPQLERVLAFFRLAQLCRGGAAPSQEQLAASDGDAACRASALQQLRDHLRAMLALYPSRLEQDEAELQAVEEAAKGGATGGAGRRERRRESCLRVLVGEKRIFHQALAWLDGRLSEG